MSQFPTSPLRPLPDPEEVRRRRKLMAGTPDALNPDLAGVPSDPTPAGVGVTAIGDARDSRLTTRPQTSANPTIQPQVRTAQEAAQNISSAITAMAPEPLTTLPQVRERQREAAAQNLGEQGVNTASLQESITARRDQFDADRAALDKARRDITRLRQAGREAEADQLAEQVREGNRQLTSGLKDLVADERLLRGSITDLSPEEQSQAFEARRQSRIDMLERNLPLVRDSFENRVSTEIANDQAALDRFNLEPGASEAEIQRATRGVGLPPSQVETARQSLANLSNFDIEGFVNAPISTVSPERRQAAITRVLGEQRGAAGTTPGGGPEQDLRAESTVDDIVQAYTDQGIEVPLVVGDVEANAVARGVENVANQSEGAVPAFEALISTITTAQLPEDLRAAIAQSAIDQIDRTGVLREGIDETGTLARGGRLLTSLGTGLLSRIGDAVGLEGAGDALTGIQTGVDAATRVGSRFSEGATAVRRARERLQEIVNRSRRSANDRA